MTRIIFQWMLIFTIGGILLFVSGESTVPTTADGKTPNSVTPLILSTTENRSSEISSSSVASKTNEEPEKLAPTASNIELDEASKTPEPLNGDKSHNLLNSEVLSTEVLTTLFSTDPTSEDSEHGSSTERQEMTSTSKGNVISDKEYEIKIDVLDAEEASDKSLPSPANEIHETSTNIVGTTNEIRYKKDSFSTMSSEEKLSPQTEYSMSPSSLSSFTSESSPTGDALVEGSTPVKTSGGQTTEVKNTEEYPEKQLPNHVDNVHLSEVKTAEPTLAVSESTRHLETETVEMTENTDRMESEDKSTENSLSLHQTTPKSATKKRSLNNTGDIILHRETTAASDALSSSFQPELTTILEHGDSSVSGSGDEMIIFIKSNATEKESNMQNPNESSAEALSPIAAPSISSGFGSIENVEEREKYVMPHSNPEKTNENYSTLSAKAQDNMSEKKTSGVERGTGSVNPTLHSEASVIVPKTSDDYSHLNNLDNVDNTFSGVTFDPDGMKNSEPQDPDSVVFFVPSTKFDKTSTPENIYPSTTFTVSGSSESEREFEFVTHKNLNEGGDSGNETGESEKMVHIPLDKNINVPPQLSHNPVESAEIETFGTANNSNSSSNFVFWDPSNGGWILPKTTTDTQIKRIDTGLNDESEEMLQDAPQFFDHKSPTSNLKTDPKEKDEIKSTVGDRTSSFSKELETETVTEAGFIGFSNSFVPHQTDQSVIRPVKIKLTSPDDKSVSTSVLPESFSTLAPEESTGLKLSEPIAGPTIEKIETSSSSPKILPDSTPSVITEIVKSPELSTIVIQPELVPFSLDKKSPEATGTSNTSSAVNSTIAGIAVKTSVSVSLPLSKSKNDSQALQPLIEELMKKLNSSSLLVNGSTISLKPETSEPSSPNPSDSSTDGLTITSDQTTTETGFKIRKPKIKIPGGTDSNTPRPYRPFTPGLKKPTTTAGPPISIFRKQKTRIASITSSTTARPYRPFNGNFATVKIQFASDIPGLLPQEFLISTEPVTTTTTEPTTTEEPISEVPFTDQTHIPTVANEDDVTLVKVAGYIEIDRGLRWNELLDNRHSPEYKKNAEAMHLYLERMFRSSPIASRLWKIKIDGFSNNNKKMRPVGVDFFLYLIKTRENIPTKHLAMVFHEKLSSNNTFGTFRVDPSKTTFEMLQEEPLKPPTPPPEEENVEPPIPQWAIAVIVIGAASLIFIVLFAAVTIYGRHHMRRRYSSKLNEEDMERSSGEWESKMAAAYENMAADTIYDAEDPHSDSYKKSYILD